MWTGGRDRRFVHQRWSYCFTKPPTKLHQRRYLIGCVYPAAEDPIQQVTLVGRSHLPVAKGARVRVDYPEGLQSTLEVGPSDGGPMLRLRVLM